MAMPDPMEISVRTFMPDDNEACRELYAQGLLGGQLAENDSGLDIDDIAHAYLRPGCHFWVAQDSAAQVVGMIGVQNHEDNVGEIRRLRVRADSQRRGVGSRLLEAAIAFCRTHQYLKVKLDTFIEREPAVRLFEKFQFRQGSTRQLNGKLVMDFYLDIYGGEVSS